MPVEVWIDDNQIVCNFVLHGNFGNVSACF